jgi:hypothetical protein
MFELEIDSPTRMRLRLGRWHLRTWRTPFMLLPKGYRSPEPVFAVEIYDEEAECSRGQLGVFFTEADAQACKAKLEAEGRTEIVINYLGVHSSLRDWEFDR